MTDVTGRIHIPRWQGLPQRYSRTRFPSRYPSVQKVRLFTFRFTTSIYAPEYDDFKSLFRCHATKSDYYIVYPSATRIERVQHSVSSCYA